MAGWRVERVLGAPRFVPNLLLRGIYATVFGVLELAFWSANRLAGLVSRSSIPNVDAAMDWSDLQTLRLPLSRPFLAADVLTINGPPSRDGQLTHVIFPGNPGNVRFYHAMASELAKQSGMPTVVIGHSGHSHSSSCATPFSFEDQIDHKLLILRALEAHWGCQPRYTLTGHSIGAYIALRVAKTLGPTAVVGQQLLCPTVFHIGTTPRGQQLYPILRYGRRWVVQVAELLGRLPTAWQWTLSQKVMGHDTGLDMVAAALSLMPAKVGGNCLYMGYTEMEGLRDFDLSLTKPVEESLTWYFAQTDGWVTTSHVQDIEEACPASTIMHDTLGINHGFVVLHSQIMAQFMVKSIFSRPRFQQLLRA